MQQNINKVVKENLSGRHQIDPTLVALIKSFVPQIEDIDIKRKVYGFDKEHQAKKKTLADKMRNNNKQKFNKTYT